MGLRSLNSFDARSATAPLFIGGTAAGTALILVFLPALYAIWYRVKPTDSGVANKAATRVPEPRELAMLDAS